MYSLILICFHTLGMSPKEAKDAEVSHRKVLGAFSIYGPRPPGEGRSDVGIAVVRCVSDSDPGIL